MLYLMKKLKIICLTLLLSLTTCFKEPNKGDVENSKSFDIDKVANENLVIDSIKDSIQDGTEEITVVDNRQIINNEIKDLVNQLNDLFLKSEYYNTSISIVDLEKGILKFGNYRFKVQEIIFYYLDQDKLDGFGRHHLVIECDFGESCILITYNNANAISINTPFDSKLHCEKAVEIFDEIKEAYYRK